MGIFGWDYPPGAANDPNAPWNQSDDHKRGCPCHEDAPTMCADCDGVVDRVVEKDDNLRDCICEAAAPWWLRLARLLCLAAPFKAVEVDPKCRCDQIETPRRRVKRGPRWREV